MYIYFRSDCHTTVHWQHGWKCAQNFVTTHFLEGRSSEIQQNVSTPGLKYEQRKHVYRVTESTAFCLERGSGQH